jgi:hypothetical protein
MRHLKTFENFSDKSSLLEAILPEVKEFDNEELHELEIIIY